MFENHTALHFESRWYQSEAEESFFDYFENHRGRPGNPVIAMPTGTGKSVVIAKIIRRVLQMHANTRIVMLTHVKELIEQNASKLLTIWPHAPLGIYSAGLNRRDLMLPITFGGVASFKNVVADFPAVDLLFIDEAHLLSPNAETMYQQVIAELLKKNPFLRVIGLTATAFRMKQGMITDGGIFTDICYNLCTPEMFNRLIAEGYISQPIPKQTNAHIDLSNVGIQQGEYRAGELEAASDIDSLNLDIVREVIQFGENRRSWLIFAAGIKHAEHLAEIMQAHGIPCAAVHSKLKPAENDKRIAALKSGELRAVVNMGKLTTGFDHPPIDLIGMCRATLSPGLWVQMLGRGTRPSPDTGKRNCLVLDFARNTPRLGPINDPRIPNKPGKGGGDAPVRICENCGCYNAASAMQCINCGYQFTREVKIFRGAGTEELVRGDVPQVAYFQVDKVIYSKHMKEGSPPSIKVTYFSGFQAFNEWVCLEHKGYARTIARSWWRQRMGTDPPETTDEALQYVSYLQPPTRIRVHVNKAHPEILGHEF